MVDGSIARAHQHGASKKGDDSSKLMVLSKDKFTDHLSLDLESRVFVVSVSSVSF